MAAAVLLAGCDTVFSIDHVTLHDARPAVDARMCSGSEPFGAKTEVPIDGQYSVESARFDADLMVAHLSLCPANGEKTQCELYRSLYSPTVGMFTDHTVLTAVTTAGVYDSYPMLTPDGQFLVFGSRRNGTLQIWIAEKQGGVFSAAGTTSLAGLTGAPIANEPYLANDRTLYWAASVANDDWDIYRATGTPPMFGGTATKVGGTVTTADENAPVLSADELEIFFASNRHAPTAQDALDIYVARRTSTSADFDPPTRLVEASQNGGNDWPVWVSPNGCDLYFINKVAEVATLYVSHR